MKDKIEDIFGIDKETYQKSKDILSTLDLGKLKPNSIIIGEMIEIKQVEHKSKFTDDDKIKTPVLIAKIREVKEFDGKELINIPYEEIKMSIWLSSKTLRLGFMKIYDEVSGNIENVLFKITISTADYKEYGENRTYNVDMLTE